MAIRLHFLWFAWQLVSLERRGSVPSALASQSSRQSVWQDWTPVPSSSHCRKELRQIHISQLTIVTEEVSLQIMTTGIMKQKKISQTTIQEQQFIKPGIASLLFTYISKLPALTRLFLFQAICMPQTAIVLKNLMSFSLLKQTQVEGDVNLKGEVLCIFQPHRASL